MKRLGTLIAALALVMALMAGPAAAKKRCSYCGSYHGATSDAVDPAGFTSGGGPFGFVVKRTGVVAVTASGTWNCSNGGDIGPAPFKVDKTFKKHPVKVSKKGHLAADKHFGDLHVSFYGNIKKGKFSGYFAIGFLGGGTGCGTATMPASASK